MATQAHEIAEYSYDLWVSEKPRGMVIELIAEKINILVAKSIQAHTRAEEFRKSGTQFLNEIVKPAESTAPRVQVMSRRF